MNFKKLPTLILLAFVLSLQGTYLKSMTATPGDQVEILERDSIASEERQQFNNSDEKEIIDDQSVSKSSYNVIFYFIYQFLKKNPLTSGQ